MIEKDINDLKDTPYNRLKVLIKGDDKTLTEKADSNLNQLLNITSKVTFWSRVRKIFQKIDRKIFPKSKITNRYNKR